jgi:hypothetical protein
MLHKFLKKIKNSIHNSHLINQSAIKKPENILDEIILNILWKWDEIQHLAVKKLDLFTFAFLRNSFLCDEK